MTNENKYSEGYGKTPYDPRNPRNGAKTNPDKDPPKILPKPPKK